MTSIDLERLAVRECGKPKRQQVDRERIVRLWTEPGGFWTQLEIANVCGCSISTVRRILVEEGFQSEWSFCGMTIKKIERTKCQG